MIKKIVNQWFENKNKLESYFKETPQSEYSSYEDIVKKIIELVLNQGENSLDLDISRMTVIDDGDCRGTLDESPMVYKDTSEIINAISDTAEILFFVKPRINIKAKDTTED